MLAIFAFISGLVYDLPWPYWVIGFLCLILD